MNKRINMHSIGRKFFHLLPATVAILLVFLLPPIAIAIIFAYFTAPIVSFLHKKIKLPYTLGTLIVMILFLAVLSLFIAVALYGLIDTVPVIVQQIAPYTNHENLTGKLFSFVQEKALQYGEALIEYAITFFSTFFQQVFSILFFILSFFFALRESAKNRFWFIIYFPSNIRKQAKAQFAKAGELITAFFFVEFRLFLLTFFLLSIGFIVLKFQAPIGNAFLISLVDSLPFLGIGLFLIPMSIFFFYINDWTVGIALLILFIFILITRQVVESYLWSSTFQLKPVHTFFITAFSVYLFGLAGIAFTPFFLFIAIKLRNHKWFT